MNNNWGAYDDEQHNHYWLPPGSGRGNKRDGYVRLCGKVGEVAPWRKELIIYKPESYCPVCEQMANAIGILRTSIQDRRYTRYRSYVEGDVDDSGQTG